jgi:protein-S-isoprenylcysteine O-methyltransferase Ste14
MQPARRREEVWVEMLWLKTLFFTVLYPGTVAVVLPLAIAWRDRGRVAPQAGLVAGLGWAAVALGFAIYGWCAVEFVRRGHGTPAPYDPPEDLVVTGLYRFTRNPMYVGVWTIVAGEAALFGSWWVLVYAAILGLGFHLRVLLYEEPELRRLFGERFEQYRRAVPRWIPRP